MKASELIYRLLKLMNKNGDGEVYMHICEFGDSVEAVSVERGGTSIAPGFLYHLDTERAKEEEDETDRT